MRLSIVGALLLLGVSLLSVQCVPVVRSTLRAQLQEVNDSSSSASSDENAVKDKQTISSKGDIITAPQVDEEENEDSSNSSDEEHKTQHLVKRDAIPDVELCKDSHKDDDHSDEIEYERMYHLEKLLVRDMRRRRQAAAEGDKKSSEQDSSEEKGAAVKPATLEASTEVAQEAGAGAARKRREIIKNTVSAEIRATAEAEAILDRIIDSSEENKAESNEVSDTQKVSSLEDYVQGCEVMEHVNSDEANETTYKEDRRRRAVEETNEVDSDADDDDAENIDDQQAEEQREIQLAMLYFLDKGDTPKDTDASEADKDDGLDEFLLHRRRRAAVGSDESKSNEDSKENEVKTDEKLTKNAECGCKTARKKREADSDESNSDEDSKENKSKKGEKKKSDCGCGMSTDVAGSAAEAGKDHSSGTAEKAAAAAEGAEKGAEAAVKEAEPAAADSQNPAAKAVETGADAGAETAAAT